MSAHAAALYTKDMQVILIYSLVRMQCFIWKTEILTHFIARLVLICLECFIFLTCSKLKHRKHIKTTKKYKTGMIRVRNSVERCVNINPPLVESRTK